MKDRELEEYLRQSLQQEENQPVRLEETIRLCIGWHACVRTACSSIVYHMCDTFNSSKYFKIHSCFYAIVCIGGYAGYVPVPVLWNE